MPGTSDALCNLRNLLTKNLRPTGKDGFEGLIANVLSDITGLPFRLAASGPQSGSDGAATIGDQHIRFECKLYTKPVPPAEVMNKMGHILLREGSTDLWVFCATSQVSEQAVDKVRKLSERYDVSTLILDWSQTPLPPLATALAMAKDVVAEFMNANEMTSFLNTIAQDPRFASQEEYIKRTLTGPTIPLERRARSANKRWLEKAFSDKQRARSRLGHPLAPADTSDGKAYDRTTLIPDVAEFLSGPLRARIILCITGNEGVGKSWIVAQSWLCEETKPLMLMISPNVVTGTADELDVDDTLITALIAQSAEDQSHEHLKGRWSRILARWAQQPNSDIRFVVVVDGINQRPEKDWGRILAKFADALHDIGGQLIVTVRTSYYQNDVVRRLDYPCNKIMIPDWTDEERDVILARQNITATNLLPKVASALRNPRILGIAIQMWERVGISSLHDLDVNRLLFEHIRASEMDSPSPRSVDQIIRIIRCHAEEVLSRVQRSSDDLAVFEGRVEAVVEGRFFKIIEDDPSRYELTDDCLPLALAFLAIDRMRRARRNGRDPSEALKTIVDPIASLDVTSDVLFAAMTVTCVDNSYPGELVVALIEEFGELQNLRSDYFRPLVDLATRRTRMFTKAAYNICLKDATPTNFDLIMEALRIAISESDSAWPDVRDYVQSWLNYYYIGPGGRPRRAVVSEQEMCENRTKLRELVSALSTPEKRIFDDLSELETDLDALHQLGFALLASKPRAPAAKALVRRVFAMVMSNQYYYFSQLVHLIRFNTVDWSEARLALLREVEVLRSDNVSKSGRWALVHVLRATGHADDAMEASRLAEQLGGSKSGTWRLVEEYCAADPCDPSSFVPDNIKVAVKNYKAICFDNIGTEKKPSHRNIVFDEARPAMARFEKQTAVVKHLDYARAIIAIVDRRVHDLHALRSHNALLKCNHVRSLLLRIGGGSGVTHKKESDRWISDQECLLLALPFLDGSEQIDALTKAGTEPILDLIDNLCAVDGDTFGGCLEEAYRTDNEVAQFATLVVGSSTGTPITPEARAVVTRLLVSTSDRVRAQAMGVVARLDDVDLLRKVACSEWSATGTRYDDDCYGSQVLLSAVQRELVGHKDALCRMSTRYYGPAAIQWSPNQVGDISRLIDSSIRDASTLKVDFDRDIEIDVRHGDRLRCSAGLSADAVFERNEDALQRFSVSDEEFHRRWENIRMEFECFERRVRTKNCYVILDYFDFDEFRAIVEADYHRSSSWYNLFINLSDSQLRVLYNLVLLLGYSLSCRCADKAVALFNRVKHCKPMVRVWYGHARVSIDALSIWRCADVEALNTLRILRLDDALDDYQISQEVLAAHLNGKIDLVQNYIERKLDMEEPLEKARALMVAGFSDRSEFSDDVLDRYRNVEGFVGEACNAARYAYERNTWARHWYGEMCRAKDRIEFWRFSVLFLKIVDGRYDLWASEYVDRNEPMRRFFPNLRYALNRRLNKWKRLRERRLFGADIPKEWFLRNRSARQCAVTRRPRVGCTG